MCTDIFWQGDNSLLRHSTPELERWFAKPPAELPRQNVFPLAFVLFFFLLAFAGELLTLLALLPADAALSRRMRQK